MRPDEPSNWSETSAGTPEAPPWMPPEQPVVGGYPQLFHPYPAAPYPGGYPPPSPQPYPGFVPPRPVPRNEVGLASLWLGIFAAVLFWLPVVDLVLGITAIWTGIAARRRIKRGEADNNRATITGIVLGILVSVVSIVIILIVAGFLALMINYQNCIDHAVGRAQYAQC